MRATAPPTAGTSFMSPPHLMPDGLGHVVGRARSKRGLFVLFVRVRREHHPVPKRLPGQALSLADGQHRLESVHDGHLRAPRAGPGLRIDRAGTEPPPTRGSPALRVQAAPLHSGTRIPGDTPRGEGRGIGENNRGNVWGCRASTSMRMTSNGAPAALAASAASSAFLPSSAVVITRPSLERTALATCRECRPGATSFRRGGAAGETARPQHDRCRAEAHFEVHSVVVNHQNPRRPPADGEVRRRRGGDARGGKRVR